MTDEIDTEDELTENNEQNQPETDENIDEEEELETTEVPVISNASQVEPLSVVEFFEGALVMLHSCLEEDADYVDEIYKKYFGNDYTSDDLNLGIDDERQQAVATQYIRDRLDFAKMLSTSLDKKKIDKAFENIFSMVGMTINIANSVESLYDDIFAKRIGDNVFLMQDYEVMRLNRQVWHIYTDKVNITELSSLVTTMEDLAISIDDVKDAQDFKIVSKEQLAQFYYNISEIYESEANRKSNMPDINKWHYRAMGYKKKALETTSRNIVLIANIQNDWKDYGDYEPTKITEACERVIGNEAANDRDKFRAHKLCADTLLKQRKIDGFAGKGKNIDEAIKHYRDALTYVSNRDDKIDILSDISKAQKLMYPKDYISTRLEIAELLEGRPRIREYERLADFAKDTTVKTILLKSCLNEFHELQKIDIEDRNLYDKIDRKLRDILPSDDVKTLKTLDKLRKEYGKEQKKSGELLFPMMSSKGHDYFNK